MRERELLVIFMIRSELACAGIKFKVENTLQRLGKTTNVATESLSTIIPLIQEGIEECRRIQMDLRPSILDDLGLLAYPLLVLQEVRDDLYRQSRSSGRLESKKGRYRMLLRSLSTESPKKQ